MKREDSGSEQKSYQIYVTDITWNENTIGNYRSRSDKYENVENLPKQFSLDLQDGLLAQANKNPAEFNDVIETFVYNFLTRKFGHEVYHCSIFLPLEDEQ